MTAYTGTLGLALPVQGTLDGTWGDVVNNSITSLIEDAITATTTLTADADTTLTTTDGASNQARNAVLLCSGARTATRTITAPAASKLYVVINTTTGGQDVKLVGAGPTTGVTITNGTQALVAWNGSDFVTVASSAVAADTVTTAGTQTLTNKTIDAASNTISNVSLTADVTGTLPVTNGGTGATTATAAQQNLGVEVGVDVQAYSTNLASWATKTAPTGTAVGTSDTQTLTNKTLEGATLTNGYTEEVYALSGTTVSVDPVNGSIQTWSLTANSSVTANLTTGQSVMLGITPGAYNVSWPTMTWTKVGGSGIAPGLYASGVTWVVIWKVGTTLYGSHLGDA